MGSFKSWMQRTAPIASLSGFVSQLKEEAMFTWIGSHMMRERAVNPSLEWGEMQSSDWDFMFNCQSLEARVWLAERGFISVDPREEDYFDPCGIQCLYRHPDVEGLDVIGKNYYAAHKELWEKLTPKFFYKYLWKSNPTRDPEKVDEHKEFIRDYFNQQVRFLSSMRRGRDVGIF